MYMLYYSPGACSLAPHIVLEEIGTPFELKLVSTSDGSTRSSEHLKINPKGNVPVLDTGEHIITEASAIMMYLALENVDSQLIDRSPLLIARTIEWMSWLSGIHSSIIAQNWRTERFSDDQNAHKEIQEKGMANLKDICEKIDSHLAPHAWAAGENYSIADPYLLVFFRWGNRLGLDMRRFEHWTEHASKLEKRAAVQRVLSAEGISIWH